MYINDRKNEFVENVWPANSALNVYQCFCFRVNITVRRCSIFDDLVRSFEDDSILEQTVRVQVSREETVDADGVLRDVLTDFWGQLINRHF